MRIFLASLLLAVSVAPLASQQRSVKPVWPDEGPLTWAPRKTTAEITADDLRTRLYQIADDSMLGRRIGELGNFKTTEYIANEFKRLGLKPAGDNGTYFQILPHGPLGFDMASARLAIGGSVLTGKLDWIPVTPSGANGYAGIADLTDVPTVFAGTWGDTSVTLDPALFRGRIAVFRSDVSGNEAESVRAPASLVSCADVPDKFGAAAAAKVEAEARANPAPPTRFARFSGPVHDGRAQAAGALGIMIVGLDGMSASARAAAVSPRGVMQPSSIPGESGSGVGATISASAAQKLFGRAVDQIAVGTRGNSVSARWKYGWTPTATPARNVVAVLPGSDPSRASEYVLVGAHSDHVGALTSPVDHDSLRAVNMVTRKQGANDPVCVPTADQQARIDALIARARSIRPPRLDSIMNGADDDGSGTAVLLEIAEKFATEKPARSIIFIAHQGEEGGLLGSRWFVDHPTVPLEQIVAAHNMDMLGKGRADQVKFGGPNSVQTLGARRLSPEFGDIIDSVNAVRSEPMAIDKSWDVTANPMNRFCRSDQVNYVNKDIPVTYFSLGYSLDYHQATDEPQYIEYEHSARLGRFIHDVMLAIATRAERPRIVGQDPAYPSCRR